MKKLEILQELPRCDKGNEQMLLENGTNRLASHRVATNLQFVKKNKVNTIKQGMAIHKSITKH